jgi:hypothetical protein
VLTSHRMSCHFDSWKCLRLCLDRNNNDPRDFFLSGKRNYVAYEKDQHHVHGTDRDNHCHNNVKRKRHDTKYEQSYSMGELVQQIGDMKLFDDVVMVTRNKNHHHHHRHRHRHNKKSMQRKRPMAECDACDRELQVGQIILYSIGELVSQQDHNKKLIHSLLQWWKKKALISRVKLVFAIKRNIKRIWKRIKRHSAV